MGRAFRSLAVAAARAAEDKKGEDIALLHPGAANPLADYLLIVTAGSRPHIEALEEAIARRLKELDAPCRHRARPATDAWRILDYGGLLVHIMAPESRSFYGLDKLYLEAPRVRWTTHHARSARHP